MESHEELNEWFEFTSETVEALLLDGSDSQQKHTIEYHFAAYDFDALEKAAVDIFKAGFEVTDAEEYEDEEGETLFAFDAIVERMLNIDKINQDITKLIALADKHDVVFDGWGTHFIEQDS